MYFHLFDVLAATFLLSIWLPLLNIFAFFVYSNVLRNSGTKERQSAARRKRNRCKEFMLCEIFVGVRLDKQRKSVLDNDSASLVARPDKDISPPTIIAGDDSARVRDEKLSLRAEMFTFSWTAVDNPFSTHFSARAFFCASHFRLTHHNWLHKPSVSGG